MDLGAGELGFDIVVRYQCGQLGHGRTFVRAAVRSVAPLFAGLLVLRQPAPTRAGSSDPSLNLSNKPPVIARLTRLSTHPSRRANSRIAIPITARAWSNRNPSPRSPPTVGRE
ncbi:MAG: hypothetical protein H0X27_02295 [Caulobacteraceae bacterium]|nr:hypothetical protein [Caulobacteraceae bacterium]